MCSSKFDNDIWNSWQNVYSSWFITIFTKIVDMASSDKVVDYNPQITLQKVPTDQYPANEEVFQLKYIPPIPIDQVKAG